MTLTVQTKTSEQKQMGSELDPQTSEAVTNPSTWYRRYTIGKNDSQKLREKRKEWYDRFYSQHESPESAPWRSKVKINFIAPKIWDLIARFAQYRIGWEVEVRDFALWDQDAEGYQDFQDVYNKRVELVQDKMQYDYDCPYLDVPVQENTIETMLDAAVGGTGFARVQWANKMVSHKSHDISGQGFQYELEEVMDEYVGYNTFDPIDPNRMILPPGTKHLQKAPWIIVHDFKRLEDLQEENEATGNTKYKNLDFLKGTAATSDEFAQYSISRNSYLQSHDPISADPTVKYVETLECHERSSGDVVLLAKSGSNIPGNEWLEIYRQKNPYWHGKYPFVPFYVRKKPRSVYGESLYENAETLEEAANDIFNHYIDSMHISQDGMIMIDEDSSVEPYIIEPGGELRYNGDAPQQFKFPDPNPVHVQQALSVIDRAFESVLLSQYASGVPNSATDKTAGTATGITRLQEAAAEKVGFMRANFRRSWREVGQMWLSNSQQFMDEPVVITKTIDNVVQAVAIRPEDLQGRIDLKVDDSSFEPVSKDEQRQNHLEYVNHMLLLQKSSMEQMMVTKDPRDFLRLNYNALAKEGTDKFAKPHFNNYVVQNTGTEVEAQEQREMAGGGQAPATPGVEGDPAQDVDQALNAFLGEVDQGSGAVQADQSVVPGGLPATNSALGALGLIG